MKRAGILVLLAALCLLLAGCSKPASQAQPLAVYAFSGSGDGLSVTNGVIVRSDAQSVFFGGDLSIEPEDRFQGISAFTETFSVHSGEGEVTLLSNSVTDQTGGAVHPGGQLGKRAGEDDMLMGVSESDLQNNLFFELQVTYPDGETQTCRVHLQLTKITAD